MLLLLSRKKPNLLTMIILDTSLHAQPTSEQLLEHPYISNYHSSLRIRLNLTLLPINIMSKSEASTESTPRPTMESSIFQTRED